MLCIIIQNLYFFHDTITDSYNQYNGYSLYINHIYYIPTFYINIKYNTNLLTNIDIRSNIVIIQYLVYFLSPLSSIILNSFEPREKI